MMKSRPTLRRYFFLTYLVLLILMGTECRRAKTWRGPGSLDTGFESEAIDSQSLVH